ncbi:MAG: multisubunit Na+/H+ antiporter, MnhE subunit [uncultured archaeon A07HR60]|nr:MAG: multisubunit Na+/H+ antiporter, MnhE subunit [uncultured archaeon A07HR60]
MISVADNHRVLLPVTDTPTLRECISWLVNEFDSDEIPEIHLVYIASWRGTDPRAAAEARRARELLDQSARFVEVDLEDRDMDGSVESAILGQDTRLFGPNQYAGVLQEYATTNEIEEIVLDPQYSPNGKSTLLQPLEFELSRTDLSIREAQVTRPSRRAQLRQDLSGARFAVVFGLALGFYLILGDPTYWFDLVTGVASATIVATVLGRISLDSNPTFPGTVVRILRHIVYVPILLAEIIKSNIAVSRVILSPSLPIEPRLTRMRVRVGSGFPMLTLANSITLTPGTLTVRASDADLYVHTLIPWAREGLFDGSLERWTRFIYYGREAFRVQSPRDRDDCVIFQGPEATEPLPGPLYPVEAQPDGGTQQPMTDATDVATPSTDSVEATTAEETDSSRDPDETLAGNSGTSADQESTDGGDSGQ